MMGLQEEAALVGRKKVRGLRREGLLGMKTEAEQSEKLLPRVKQPPRSLCAEPGSGFLFIPMLFAPSFQLCQSLMGISFLTLPESCPYCQCLSQRRQALSG